MFLFLAAFFLIDFLMLDGLCGKYHAGHVYMPGSLLVPILGCFDLRAMFNGKQFHSLKWHPTHLKICVISCHFVTKPEMMKLFFFCLLSPLRKMGPQPTPAKLSNLLLPLAALFMSSLYCSTLSPLPISANSYIVPAAFQIPILEIFLDGRRGIGDLDFLQIPLYGFIFLAEK